MFNDPSGEFAWAAGFFLTYVAPVIWGAVVGTLISVGMYTIQSLVMNSWSWNGFANALLMGAVTGGVSGGLGQVFSASGFWGTVGNGTLAGAGSGGATALITGKNFLEGVIKGAVIGGVVSALNYHMSYYANGYDKVRYKTTSSNISEKDKYGLTYDNNISQETMQNNVNTMRSKNFTLSEMDEFGVGKDTVGFGGYDGYIYPGNGTKVFAYTTPKNYWTGKSDIVYAPITAQNKELLAATMVHETGHVYAQKLGLISMVLDTKALGINSNLDSTEHWSMSNLEHVYADKNLISMTRRLNGNFYTNPDDILEPFFKVKILRSIVDETSKKLLPVFNRFMFYTK